MFAYLFVTRLFRKRELAFPIRKKTILKTFEDFDILIGSGIMPAVFNRVNKKLTVYYPYAVGVEYLGSSVFLKHLNSKNLIQRCIAQRVFLGQKSGLKQTKTIFTSSCQSTNNILQKYRIDYIPSLIPTVYDDKRSLVNGELETDWLSKIRQNDFIILSHARHHWKKPFNVTDEKWSEENKHNDWIIKSFAKFLTEIKYKAKLVMFEYGQDVSHSKQLCDKLNLTNHIIWLPVSPRKNILEIIEEIDVGLGEFYSIPGVTWGSTLIEFMSKGKPVIHGCLIDKEKFIAEYGMAFPPLLAANSELEIYHQLIFLYENDLERKRLSKESLEWFNNNYGNGLTAEIMKKILENYAT